MKPEISFKEYSYLCNRIGYWLINTGAKFTPRSTYNTDNRVADYGTIKKTLLARGTNYETDPMINEFVECAIHDNNDKSFLPNYVTGSDGTKYDKPVYVDMANRVAQYEVLNKAHPNTVSTKIVATTTVATPTKCSNPYTQKGLILNTGVTGMGQGTPYYCACNSVQQALYKLTGINIAESTLASVMGTTTSGTSHNGIETGVAWFNRKYGYNLKVEWKSFNSLGGTLKDRFKALGELMCQSNKAVFCHLLYRNQWGHYEVPYKVNTSNSIIQVVNSLGTRVGNGYAGYLEDRTFNTHQSYMNGISQKGVCVITK